MIVPRQKFDVYPRIITCIYEVILAFELPRSTSPFPFDKRTGWLTCNTSNFAPAELQNTTLEPTNAHLQTAVSSRWAGVGFIFEYPFKRWMVVSEVLRLQTNKMRVVFTFRARE